MMRNPMMMGARPMGMGMLSQMKAANQAAGVKRRVCFLICTFDAATDFPSSRFLTGPPPPPLLAPAEKSTTVYVGKIAPTLEDSIVRTLLDACGGVQSWKRASDPETQELKGFGFVEFEDAEGVLRAIRLLNGLKIDGQELMVKGNTATQRYLEAYELSKVRVQLLELAGHRGV